MTNHEAAPTTVTDVTSWVNQKRGWLATKNSAEIRDAVEDGKKRLAQLATDGNALLLETKAN